MLHMLQIIQTLMSYYWFIWGESVAPMLDEKLRDFCKYEFTGTLYWKSAYGRWMEANTQNRDLLYLSDVRYFNMLYQF